MAPYTYMFLEDVEDLEDYKPGGFHPISIGDTFRDGGHRIVHKLGFGGSLTIWLAKDGQRDRYVALKVAAADAPDGEYECRVLSKLVEGNVPSSTPGLQYIPPILDHFTITGPNGHHPCVVTAPARLSLRNAKEDYSWPSLCPTGYRAIVAQLVEAVVFVHSRGVVHGDIHPGNALLLLPDTFHFMTPDDIYQKFQPPDQQPIQRCDGGALPGGVPPFAVTPIWLGLGKQKATLRDVKVVLTDFGEAFLPEETPRTYSNTPASYAPPEARFTSVSSPLSFPADIWSLACTLWEVLGLKPLFEPWAATDDDILADQVDLLGKLPEKWWACWDARRAYFTEAGQVDTTAVNRRHDSVRHDWQDALRRCIHDPRRRDGLTAMTEREEEALLVMLRSMLVFDPEKRASATEILESEWMKRWAMPDLQLARRQWQG